MFARRTVTAIVTVATAAVLWTASAHAFGVAPQTPSDCKTLGIHAFARGNERDSGMTLLDALLYTRGFYHSVGSTQAQIEHWDWWTQWVFNNPGVSPANLRLLAEGTCFKYLGAQQAKRQTQQPSYDVRYRY